MSCESLAERLGIKIPRILLPSKAVDLTKWAVVACDQFTSEPKYWEQVDEIVGESPSTLRLILPEVYLGSLKESEIMNQIKETMTEYLQNGTLMERSEPGFVLVERSFENGKTRKGLIMSLDLDRYEWEPGNEATIRATEATIANRIPPRLKVRNNASIEFPHIIVLIDDLKRTVIESLNTDYLECLYNFQLMQGSGRIKGFWLGENEQFQILKALSEIYSSMLFAVGDGNHSMATAKAYWEERKKAGAASDDPARFCLVEVENIHDEGIVF